MVVSTDLQNVELEVLLPVHNEAESIERTLVEIYRTVMLQEGDRIMDMLPGVIAPRTQAFSFEPTPYGASRDARRVGSWATRRANSVRLQRESGT